MNATGSPPSSEEIQIAADVIERLPKGFLPYPLFMAITAKVVTPTLELAIFRNTSKGLEILLTRRPDDDKYWPGEWHVPGTVIRSTDQEGSYKTCFERILSDELQGLVAVSDPVWVKTEFWDMERGREIDQLHYAMALYVQDLPNDSAFFSVNELPNDLMRHHRSMIATIVDIYKNQEAVG